MAARCGRLGVERGERILRVLVACEFSGIVRRAFRARGHDAWSCDLRPAEDDDLVYTQTGERAQHIQADVLGVLYGPGLRQPMQWDLLIAHPPCTRLTNAGVRWLRVPPPGRALEDVWTELRDGIEFYRALRDAPVPKKAVENPVMHLYARIFAQPGPRQIVQPWWFGEPFFKATGFELIGLPPLVATNRLTKPKPGTEEHKKWSAVHREPPGEEREKNRSRTYPGVAQAMAEQWGLE